MCLEMENNAKYKFYKEQMTKGVIDHGQNKII